MRCYLCKKTIAQSTRAYLEVRNHREQSGYRDVCNECYAQHMTAKGYRFIPASEGRPAMWVH